MKKKSFIFALSAICSAFVIAILYLLCGLIADRHNGPFITQNRFNKLVQETRINIDRYNPETVCFADSFIASLGDINDYKSISLTVNGNLLYSYPPVQNPSDVSSLVKYYSKTDRVNDSYTMKLTCEMYTLNSTAVFMRARLSFLIILAATLSAFLLIFLSSSESTVNVIEDEDNQTEVNEQNFDRIVPVQNNELDTEIEAKDDDLTPPEVSESFFEEYEEPVVIEPVNVTENADTNHFELIEKTEQIEEEPFVDNYDFEEPEVTDNYLPENKETDLFIRIDAILSDAAAKDQDVSVIVNKIKNTDNSSPEGELIVKLLALSLNTNNVYKYQNDSYICVLTDTDLDKSLLFAEKVHKELSEHPQLNSVGTMLTGISSRSSRILTGERLVSEALQASERAEDDPSSPIVAFRVDPDKYKEYVLNS